MSTETHEDKPTKIELPAQLVRTFGIVLAWILFPLALQRVLYPSLGKLRTIFIIDAVVFVSAILMFVGAALGYKGEAILIIFGISFIISLIVLIVFVTIDIVKLYLNKVS